MKKSAEKRPKIISESTISGYGKRLGLGELRQSYNAVTGSTASCLIYIVTSMEHFHALETGLREKLDEANSYIKAKKVCLSFDDRGFIEFGFTDYAARYNNTTTSVLASIANETREKICRLVSKDALRRGEEERLRRDEVLDALRKLSEYGSKVEIDLIIERLKKRKRDNRLYIGMLRNCKKGVAALESLIRILSTDSGEYID